MKKSRIYCYGSGTSLVELIIYISGLSVLMISIYSYIFHLQKQIPQIDKNLDDTSKLIFELKNK